MSLDPESSTNRGNEAENNSSVLTISTSKPNDVTTPEDLMSCILKVKAEQNEYMSKVIEMQTKMQTEINKIEDMVRSAKWPNTATNSPNVVTDIEPASITRENIDTPRENSQPRSSASEAVHQQSNNCSEIDDSRSQVSTTEGEWLREVEVLKSPYFPQLDDQIVYFRQGHKEYLDAVRRQRLYTVNEIDGPWTYMNINAQEFVKVIGIVYELDSPRMACLILERVNNEGESTAETFEVKYHDMKGVVDFLVLKQTFDRTVERNWKQGDKFRCLVNDQWFFGRVETTAPFDVQFPESHFKRIGIKWDDDGLEEKLSPWELEPIDELRVPLSNGQAPLRPDELQIFSYRALANEWPTEGRETFCCMVLRQLNKLAELPVVEPLVNLNTDPTYMAIVEYPVDLATMKARLQKGFYRRLVALKFDAERLATNIEEMKKQSNKIDCMSKRMKDDLFVVGKYKLIANVISRIIDDPKDKAIDRLFKELDDFQETPDINDNESESSFAPTHSSQSHSQLSTQGTILQTPIVDWQLACMKLLNTLWENGNSISFRNPVDELDYPDYRRVITNPICLQEIKESFVVGDYKSPIAFSNDLNLMFKNSRKYTPSKKATMYGITTRLQKLYEQLMEPILSSWRSTRSLNSKRSTPSKSYNSPSKSDTEVTFSDNDEEGRERNINEAGPSRVHKEPSVRFGNAYFKSLDNSDDSDWTENINSTDNSKNDDEKGKRKRSRRGIIEDDDDNDTNSTDNSKNDEKGKRKRSRRRIIEDDDDDDTNSTDNSKNDDEDSSTSEDSDEMNDNLFESDSSSEEEHDSNKRTRRSKVDSPTKMQIIQDIISRTSFTSSYELSAIRPGQQNVNITGVVSEVDEVREIYSSKTKAHLDLLKFIVDNGKGIKVHCYAWEMEAKLYEGKIKRNQIIRITNAVAQKPTIYNHGNVNYELALRYFTRVSVSK